MIVAVAASDCRVIAVDLPRLESPREEWLRHAPSKTMFSMHAALLAFSILLAFQHAVQNLFGMQFLASMQFCGKCGMVKTLAEVVAGECCSTCEWHVARRYSSARIIGFA